MKPFLLAVEWLGIVAFALSGIIEARKKAMDIVGVFFVALATAFGGGTLRDLLIQNQSILWMQSWVYPVAILLLAALARWVPQSWFDRAPGSQMLMLSDAIGLGMFSLTGTYLGLSHGYDLFISTLIGVITGTFGGVARDVACNEVPQIFVRSELYATCSFLGSLGFALLYVAGVDIVLAILLCATLIIVLRIVAVIRRVTLPF